MFSENLWYLSKKFLHELIDMQNPFFIKAIFQFLNNYQHKQTKNQNLSYVIISLEEVYIFIKYPYGNINKKNSFKVKCLGIFIFNSTGFWNNKKKPILNEAQIIYFWRL